MFPDNDTLLARGKYATLSKERWAQVERVQTISKTIMHLANPLLKDCEEKPPVDASPLVKLEECIKNARSARNRLIELSKEMNELHDQAWPK